MSDGEETVELLPGDRDKGLLVARKPSVSPVQNDQDDQGLKANTYMERLKEQRTFRLEKKNNEISELWGMSNISLEPIHDAEDIQRS